MAEILLGNIKGDKGDTGASFKVLEYYATLEELTASVPNPSVGDSYGVGSDYPYEIYVYSKKHGWVNNGTLQPDINEQTPNFEEAKTLETLTSGEKISLAFGKIKKAITDLISHIGNKKNPHGVTAEQVGALSKTKIIDGKDILGITTDGWYYSRSTINVPTLNDAGYVRVMVYASTYRVVYWRPHDSLKEYVNVLNGGTWLGWSEVFTNNGGSLIGNVEIKKNDSPYFTLRTNKGFSQMLRNANDTFDGGVVLKDCSNSEKGSSYMALNLKHSAPKENSVFLTYSEDENVNYYDIYGEHNKPTGSYSGQYNSQSNQSTDEFTVSIGGIGSALLINGMFLVTYKGAFVGNNEGVSFTDKIKYRNGTLNIIGSTANLEGTTYTYQVL